MRRADRLFRVVQLLRRHKVVTAERMARELEVSERTLYRDIRDLALSGVPVRGEAGVGYALDKSFDLPPLMFDGDELEAIVLGARLVQAHGDAELARAAASALAKVELVLPEKLKQQLSETALLAPQRGAKQGPLGLLRRAVRDRRRVTFCYLSGPGEQTTRTVRPLGLALFGKVWTLASWCELRKDFRAFRLDRMSDFEERDVFPEEPGKTLQDFIRHAAARGAQRSRTGANP